ncbi:hypothetical protein [Mesorhizobium sp. ISC11]|uniref:hypothetical protein n=1 Tax=Mesorhizobium sp. ISC11 TaxID=3076428 RepID=UPI00301C9903
MTSRLALTERQITVLCRGAAKAGHFAEVKIGDVIVRLIPKSDDEQPTRPIDPGADIEL